jgi:lincosamide nucleotidyltransferase A/C/D/E
MPMPAATVLEILDRLRTQDLDVCLAGGWGIDALLGRQTREHRDLDLLHRAGQETQVLQALHDFRETENARPVRFVLTREDGAELDLHPLHFAPDGSATQAADDHGGTFAYPAACFVTGTIAGTPVPCISVAQQRYFHRGYEPRPHDIADMRELRAQYRINTEF